MLSQTTFEKCSSLCCQDVYITWSSLVLILVCVWHAIVYTIGIAHGKEVASRADIGVLISFAALYVVGQIMFGLRVGIRVSGTEQARLIKDSRHYAIIRTSRKSTVPSWLTTSVTGLQISDLI